MRNEPGVFGCMGLWDLWIKRWRHPETSRNNETMPMRWDLCCPPSLSINSRVQSKASSILCLDAHDQENVKYHFQWKIGSILNHPDPPLKFSDACWVGTTRLRKTLAKHLFHKKSGNPSETLFWKCIVEKSHLQVLFQDVVQQLTPKKTAKNHHQPRTSMAPPVGTFCVKTSSFNWINSSDLH